EIPYDYWLLGFTSSYYTYHQTIPGINQHYQYSGNSRNNDVTLTRLFYRDASRKSSAFVKIWERSSANYIDDTEIEIQTRRMAGWEIGFTHKEFIGSAALEAHAAYHRGTGVFQSRHAPEEAYDEGTSRPKIVTAHVQANIPFALLGQRFIYTGNWRRQWNHTPLVPQDRFSIGNRYTVRGFDGELTLMGDRGWLIRNDLALALGNTGQQLYIGVDYGEVQGQSTRWIQGRYLAGAAVGIRGGYKGFYWDAFASTPLNKPEGFPTQNVYAGFSVGWSY
ncbi:MAG: ShlB/FhaC/HecB family hemolysin secretion/activation protein, partial [Burkholderiaceae bacterium]|nr:ShlB/FhaC/HecB family hemolysin secretion/activation protein [Burkholderiaceae bacterium]